jgi:hypothetical protein
MLFLFVARLVSMSEPVEKRSYYYVSSIDGERRFLVAGPYDTHERALSLVEAVREHVDSLDPRSHFMWWGTAGSDENQATLLGVFEAGGCDVEAVGR